MQQFNLDTWLQDKSRKVVTRDGKPVRIVCWDVKGPFPILALIMGNGEMDTKVGEEYPCSYKVDGTCPVSDSYNLFFADEEEELTEFDYAVLSIISDHNSHKDSITEFAKRSSKKLLDLARKEILKDLPKWKKAKKDEELDCHVAIQQDGRVVLSDFVQKDEYYITLNVLKKLPKEE